ncbi:MAG: hypothetical protein JO281_02530 [Pseudonocardiales bacterium]|nr:hypothetical protein [Pseudonocardiales bacterium]
MNGNPFRSWPQRIITSLLVVLAVALAAHLADALLMPLVPLLIWAIVLMGVFALLLNWLRR